MSQIINLDEYRTSRDVIDLGALQRGVTRKLSEGMIAPAVEMVDEELAEEHAAEPIKRMEDIERISKYLIDNRRFRDNMLFIVGINFGLRVSDLRVLRFSNIINDNCTFKDSFPVFEKKTRNTRARKKNRYVTINTAVVEAVTLYLSNTPGVCLSDYMFRNQATNAGDNNVPLTARSIDRILKGIARDLDLNMRMSTHSLRKTFGYHQMLMSNHDGRKLLLLQKMFNHSSPAQTLEYIGITEEEIQEEYLRLNLGSTQHNYLVDSRIEERDVIG